MDQALMENERRSLHLTRKEACFIYHACAIQSHETRSVHREEFAQLSKKVAFQVLAQDIRAHGNDWR